MSQASHNLSKWISAHVKKGGKLIGVGDNQGLQNLYRNAFQELSNGSLAFTTAATIWALLIPHFKLPLGSLWLVFLESVKGQRHNGVTEKEWKQVLIFLSGNLKQIYLTSVETDVELQNYTDAIPWENSLHQFVKFVKSSPLWEDVKLGKPILSPEHQTEENTDESSAQSQVSSTVALNSTEPADPFSYLQANPYKGLFNQGATCYMNGNF